MLSTALVIFKIYNEFDTIKDFFVVRLSFYYYRSGLKSIDTSSSFLNILEMTKF